jgi:hypothetical protein
MTRGDRRRHSLIKVLWHDGHGTGGSLEPTPRNDGVQSD